MALVVDVAHELPGAALSGKSCKKHCVSLTLEDHFDECWSSCNGCCEIKSDTWPKGLRRPMYIWKPRVRHQAMGMVRGPFRWEVSITQIRRETAAALPGSFACCVGRIEF